MSSIDFEEVICCSCATRFWMDKELCELRKNDHDSFWCPNGHQQNYVKPKEVDLKVIDFNKVRDK